MAQRRIPLLAALAAVGLAGLNACTSYTNVPGPDAATARQDPNGRQAVRATEAALAWVVHRHPVEGPFVVNLPRGTSLETAESMLSAVGPMARLPGPDTEGLPAYHVSRVWIRVSDGKVDVVFPATDYRGRDIERAVTVWMNAGVRPWTVSRGQYWSPGTVPTPPLWTPIPAAELEAIEQARRDAERDAERAADAAEAELAQPSEPVPAEPDDAAAPDEPAVPLDPADPEA